MDLNEIKQIIEIEGGKIILVENGKPTMVILGFEDYKKKLTEKRAASLKSEQKPMPKELESDELKLEDLPL